jgi:hypothetical protein
MEGYLGAYDFEAPTWPKDIHRSRGNFTSEPKLCQDAISQTTIGRKPTCAGAIRIWAQTAKETQQISGMIKKSGGRNNDIPFYATSST